MMGYSFSPLTGLANLCCSVFTQVGPNRLGCPRSAVSDPSELVHNIEGLLAVICTVLGSIRSVNLCFR